MNNIFDKKLHSAVKEVKKIRMTHDEKEQMLSSIFSAHAIPAKASMRPIQSMYFSFSYRSMAVLVAVLVIFASTGAVFASGKSLPGNTLYSLKVNVLEPFHSALKFSPTAKAHFASDLAIKRLEEAETLADQGELDGEKEERLSGLLRGHTKDLGNALEEIKKEENKEKEEGDISDDFEKKMNSHADALDNIDVRQGNTEKESHNKIKKTARDSANKIKHNSDSVVQ